MVHIGKGDNPAGLTYVSNVVDLMLLAADTDLGSGQAYNASDGSALSWRTYVNRLADIVDAARPRITIPHGAAYGLGWSMEKVYGLLDIQHRPLLLQPSLTKPHAV